MGIGFPSVMCYGDVFIGSILTISIVGKMGTYFLVYLDGQYGTNKHITITHHQWEPIPIFAKKI